METGTIFLQIQTWHRSSPLLPSKVGHYCVSTVGIRRPGCWVSKKGPCHLSSQIFLGPPKGDRISHSLICQIVLILHLAFISVPSPLFCPYHFLPPSTETETGCSSSCIRYPWTPCPLGTSYIFPIFASLKSCLHPHIGLVLEVSYYLHHHHHYHHHHYHHHHHFICHITQCLLPSASSPWSDPGLILRK